MKVHGGSSWDDYLAEQRALFASLKEEQAQAARTGLVADPKSERHGGFRIAIAWPATVTGRAHELSLQIANLLPGAPAYPYDSIHSSIGNLRVAGDRLVDPERNPEDEKVLRLLCQAVDSVLPEAGGDAQSRRAQFGPAVVAPRMALVFGRAGDAFPRIREAVLGVCSSLEMHMTPSWGPHLTLTRFGQPADAAAVEQLLHLTGAWPHAVEAEMAAVLVGYYTVGDGEFSVTTYRSFPLN